MNRSQAGQPRRTTGGCARVRTDRAAFAALYDCYYPRIVKYCVRRLFDRSIAEDVASEVFLKVASNVRTFPGTTESDFRPWLFRIATNAVNAHLRGTGRRELLEQAARNGRLGRDGPSDRAAADREMLDWPTVHQALMELEEREQTIVSLRFFADLSHEEIGDVVQATPAAVRTARAALCRDCASGLARAFALRGSRENLRRVDVCLT